MLATPVLARASFWENKPFPDWSPEEVDRLLTDSPWARPTTVRFELGHPEDGSVFDYSDVRLPPLEDPGGRGGVWPTGGGQRRGGTNPFPGRGSGRGRGRTVPSEAYLTIRWSSALPIRQALLLEQYGGASAIPAEAMAGLDQPRPDYLVEVFGIPSMVVQNRAGQFERALAESAALLLPGGPAVEPSYVQMPPHGYYLSAIFRFPRHNRDLAAGTEAKFYAAAGRMEIQQNFKLKSMLYDGRLAL